MHVQVGLYAMQEIIIGAYKTLEVPQYTKSSRNPPFILYMSLSLFPTVTTKLCHSDASIPLKISNAHLQL